ncbi:MAG: hypothetical protein F6K11_28420 [Leptolyngbya sp. SIO3F4]|nr:hypothetical protein [Leptolyngbya sp. SIO3F4]
MSSPNASVLQQALDHLAQVLQWRIHTCFKGNTQAQTSATIPDLTVNWLTAEVPLSQFIRDHRLDKSEQLILLIALAPHLQPDFFDQWITAQLPQAGDYPQIGGWRGAIHRGFLPTGQLGAHSLYHYDR